MTAPAVRFIASVEDIPSREWERLATGGYPFLKREFFLALENSGSLGPQTGWQSHHAVIEENGSLLGFMPLFQKWHSFGEYVFDWAWADAYRRYGCHYYPKLLTAIPFTPASGPRLVLTEPDREAEVLPRVVEAVSEEAGRLGASSWHCLFPDRQISQQLGDLAVAQRLGCQYHWLNEGYRDMEDFLSRFSSRKRKTLKKERRRVAEQGLELERKPGSDITDSEWRHFYAFYQLTYLKRSGGGGYLGEEFFRRLGQDMPDNVTMVVARDAGEMVAASLFFHDDRVLYGRYWGCSREYDFLHFEACYYQGIDFAIEKGLQRFDPGAQGEHKIQRGFTPIPTWSNHWIADPRFREAIEHFLSEEAAFMEQYMDEARTLLPFKGQDQR